MEKTKVLIHVMSLGGGGAERVARDIAEGLYKIGYNVAVLADFTKPIVYPLSDCIKFYNNKPYKWLPRILNRLCFLIAHKTIKDFKPDIVIGIMWGEAFTMKVVTKLFGHKIPVIFSDHDSFERPIPDTFVRKFYKKRLSRWCDYYTVLTNADLKLCEKEGIRRVRKMINPLSIIPCETQYKNNHKIIAVGRLDAWYYKGFDVLIEAWAKIAYKYPHWSLEIIGDGSADSRFFLQRKVDDLEVGSSVSFIGHHKDMMKIYKQADIFVLSSRYEGFGLVLIEAMSQHCACIACDYKGRQGEIISDGLDGLLCDPENIDSLSSKLELLITDEDLRSTIQQNSALNLSKYSIEKVSLNWSNLIQDILNPRKN